MCKLIDHDVSLQIKGSLEITSTVPLEITF